MRHTFDVRTGVIFRNHFSGKEVYQQLTKLSKSSFQRVPTMSSASVDFISGDDSSAPGAIRLASVLPEARFFGCSDLALTHIMDEASAYEAEGVVVYRIGEGDPNVLIADALAHGATGILTEQLLPCPLPQCIVGSVDHALARIAAVRHGRPDRKLLTVGVLGHSGKTSTCMMVASMTKSFGLRTAYQCDLGSSDGVVNETSTRALPHGAELIEWIAESADCLSRVAIIEIDERSARDGHYDSIQFDVLIVTGKRELSDDYGPCGLQCMLERLTSTGIVIAPDSDVRTRKLLEESGCHHINYGTTSDSEFAAVMVDQSGGMSTLMLSAGQTRAMMETPLCGKGMASNLAATTALGVLLGHSPHQIAESLSALRSIPGRGQRLVEFGHATVVIEIGGSADRVGQALCTAKAVGVGGRIWSVLAIGEHEDPELLSRYGRTIERFAHHCVVTSREPDGQSFLANSHHVLDGVKECAAIRLVADREKAIEWTVKSAGPRDTIVVFTNRDDRSAFDSRSDLIKIEQQVKAARAKLDAAGTTDSKSQKVVADDSKQGSPIILKLFP